MTAAHLERLLWAGFAVLFAAVAVAAVLPVEPIAWIVPAWSVVVIGACVAAVGLAVGAVRLGWPGGDPA